MNSAVIECSRVGTGVSALYVFDFYYSLFRAVINKLL